MAARRASAATTGRRTIEKKMKLQGGCGKWTRCLAGAGGALALSLLATTVDAYPGALDAAFGSGGIVQTGIPLPSGPSAGFAVALQSDGKIVVAGTTGSSSSANFALARYNANGTLDTTFNSNGTVTTAVTTGEDHANAVT